MSNAIENFKKYLQKNYFLNPTRDGIIISGEYGSLYIADCDVNMYGKFAFDTFKNDMYGAINKEINAADFFVKYNLCNAKRLILEEYYKNIPNSTNIYYLTYFLNCRDFNNLSKNYQGVIKEFLSNDVGGRRELFLNKYHKNDNLFKELFEMSYYSKLKSGKWGSFNLDKHLEKFSEQEVLKYYKLFKDNKKKNKAYPTYIIEMLKAFKNYLKNDYNTIKEIDEEIENYAVMLKLIRG